MPLTFKENAIFYSNEVIFAYDDFNEGWINWNLIDKALNDIEVRDLFVVVGDEIASHHLQTENFLVKSYCLALKFAFCYGFRENIDKKKYKELWLHYEKNVHNEEEQDIYLTEIVSSDDTSLCIDTEYEESFVVRDKRYTLSACVDWQSVLGFVKDFFEVGELEEIEEGYLLALGLMKARDQGLKDGKTLRSSRI